MRIFKINNEKICVQFTKIAGDQTAFLDHYENYSKYVLGFANDQIYNNEKEIREIKLFKK